MTQTIDPVTTREKSAASSPAAAPKRRRKTSAWVQGEAWVWLTGGSLVLCIIMIIGLLGLVIVKGGASFWPKEIVRIETVDGDVLVGEVARTAQSRPQEGEELPADVAQRVADGEVVLLPETLVRVGNKEVIDPPFVWVDDHRISQTTTPEWAVALERLEWGPLYGEPSGFTVDGDLVATTPEEAWAQFEEHHPGVRERYHEKHAIERGEVGEIAEIEENARLEVRRVAIEHGEGSPEVLEAQAEFERVQAEAQAEYDALRAEVDVLEVENARYELLLELADGSEKVVPLGQVVRGYPANRIGFGERLGVYGSRWWEFLSAEPREANAEGGVFPAIFGTVLMTLIMCFLAVPFGVLAALYLREYAKPGIVVTTVRIAVNNLAGVPSIVFGVFGLGFFCYLIGASLDEILFAERLPNPTLGTGGLLWASLTLALLTLPVVIVATEEALAAVPNSMREGSYGCGATKWQTIRRIVLPRALPGILTGAILAIARGAGEVAPLMLVGAVKLAPELPLAMDFPTMGTERSFMHLGFHIYDLGFQSPDAEAARPMVFTTTLLLIAIVVVLNLTAMWGRARLRAKYEGGAI